MDNIAEAFALGEWNKQYGEEDGGDGEGISPSEASNFDSAWGSGWAAPEDEMDGSLAAHYKAASRAIGTHVSVSAGLH